MTIIILFLFFLFMGAIAVLGAGDVFLPVFICGLYILGILLVVGIVTGLLFAIIGPLALIVAPAAFILFAIYSRPRHA